MKFKTKKTLYELKYKHIKTIDKNNQYLKELITKKIYINNINKTLHTISKNIPLYFSNAKKKSKLSNYCIILDIDETVFISLHILKWKNIYASDYMDWKRNSKYCPMFKNIKKIINVCNKLKIHIIFITGRSKTLKEWTENNFKLFDIINPEIYYTKNKTNKRHKISKSYHIILNIGDQSSDLGQYTDTNILLNNPFYWI